MILLAEQLHVALDLVGDVRHHLDGFAEIIAATLLVASREQRRTKSLRKPSGKPSGQGNFPAGSEI